MTTVEFPTYSGTRCLMMPYVQGEPDSVLGDYSVYRDIVSTVFLRKGDVGFLTIDESLAVAGKPHRHRLEAVLRDLETRRVVQDRGAEHELVVELRLDQDDVDVGKPLVPGLDREVEPGVRE